MLADAGCLRIRQCLLNALLIKAIEWKILPLQTWLLMAWAVIRWFTLVDIQVYLRCLPQAATGVECTSRPQEMAQWNIPLIEFDILRLPICREILGINILRPRICKAIPNIPQLQTGKAILVPRQESIRTDISARTIKMFTITPMPITIHQA